MRAVPAEPPPGGSERWWRRPRGCPLRRGALGGAGRARRWRRLGAGFHGSGCWPRGGLAGRPPTCWQRRATPSVRPSFRPSVCPPRPGGFGLSGRHRSGAAPEPRAPAAPGEAHPGPVRPGLLQQGRAGARRGSPSGPPGARTRLHLAAAAPSGAGVPCPGPGGGTSEPLSDLLRFADTEKDGGGEAGSAAEQRALFTAALCPLPPPGAQPDGGHRCGPRGSAPSPRFSPFRLPCGPRGGKEPSVAAPFY